MLRIEIQDKYVQEKTRETCAWTMVAGKGGARETEILKQGTGPMSAG